MSGRRAWIVVADRRQAKVFSHAAPGEPLKDAGVSLEFAPATEDSDRPGRVHERVGSGRHGMEPTRSGPETEREAAGRAIAETVGRGATDRAFDRLVIAATPELIGAIRPHLPGGLDTIELPHRLVDLAHHELADRLDAEGVLGRVRR
jgi:protein required for attachment to host cells